MRFSVTPEAFEYGDSDRFENEIAEFYTYSEMGEFATNLQAFQEAMAESSLSGSWQQTPKPTKKLFITKLLDKLDLNDRTVQMKAARSILYIAQGCWKEVKSNSEQKKSSRINSMLLYQSGTFMNFIQLLNYERKIMLEKAKIQTTSKQIYIEDSIFLRVILSVLYTLTEAIRHEKELDDTEYYEDIEEFCSELQNEDDNLIMTLFGMAEEFATIQNVAFPIKKILLLLWKLLLVLLGGLDEARSLIEIKRRNADLPVNHDAPSVSNKNPPKTVQLLNERIIDDYCASNKLNKNELILRYKSKYIKAVRECLCWRPKVTSEYYKTSLERARMKYLSLYLPNDFTTTAGLPLLAQESLRVLEEHIYIPLREFEIQQEIKMFNYPLSNPETIELTPNEFIYSALFPKLRDYIAVLVNIVFCVTRENRIKNHVLGEVLTRKPAKTRIEITKSQADALRHERIILKATSAIFLLLLKHFQANHTLQFEYLSQLLIESNFFPIIFNFFSRILKQFVNPIYVARAYEFPNFLIGPRKKVTLRNLFSRNNPNQYLWMGLFTCTNCLRIVNKLMKNKEHRIKLLALTRAESILRKLISLNVPICTLYSLKLIKMHIKYLRVDWRQHNTDLITLIYLKVRYHLHQRDSFLRHEHAVAADSLNYKQEFDIQEKCMANLIEKFHKRRYLANSNDEWRELDNSFISVLAKPIRLSEDFEENYVRWLEREVYE